MLKVAIPNKGSLSEDCVQLLRDSGYKVRADGKQLVVDDLKNDVQFFYLRPRDIATYVGSGTLDAGVTGLDLLLDARSSAKEVQKLGFAKSTFRFAGKSTVDMQSHVRIQGARIASAYPHLLQDYLQEQGIEASVVRLDGAVESAIDLGVADLIADVVSTGATLRQAGLAVFGEVICESEALLICSPHSDANNLELKRMVKRFQGVLTAREYVLVDYDIPESKVADATKITPGIEGPTISELQTSGDGQKWCAVRSMVKKDNVNEIMDALAKVDAKAILVTSILASRL